MLLTLHAPIIWVIVTWVQWRFIPCTACHPLTHYYDSYNGRDGVANHQPHSTVYSDADQSKHQSSASPAFVRGIHHGPAQMASNAENVSIWWRPHEHCNIPEAWRQQCWNTADITNRHVIQSDTVLQYPWLGTLTTPTRHLKPRGAYHISLVEYDSKGIWERL